jgi:hypothetical protein
MKKKMRIAALGATLLTLMFLITMSAYAQDEKPARQEEKAAQQEDKAAQEEKHAQKQEDGKDAQHEDKRMGDEKQKHEASDQKHEGNDNVREGKPGERAGGHIPDDRFREHFGREHVFVINRPVIVEGAPRFQYGGYWFVIADPWPVGWAYTDQVYIEFIDGGYYVLSPVHPGVRVLVNVVL